MLYTHQLIKEITRKSQSVYYYWWDWTCRTSHMAKQITSSSTMASIIALKLIELSWRCVKVNKWKLMIRSDDGWSAWFREAREESERCLGGKMKRLMPSNQIQLGFYLQKSFGPIWPVTLYEVWPITIYIFRECFFMITL